MTNSTLSGALAPGSPKQLDVQPVIDTVELAERINMSPATLRYWRHQGIGPQWFKLGPRRVMYRVSDVQAWLDQQYAPTRSGPVHGPPAAKAAHRMGVTTSPLKNHLANADPTVLDTDPA